MIRSVPLGFAFLALALVGCEARRAASGSAPSQDFQESPQPKLATKAVGDAVPAGPATEVSALLKDPSAFAGREVIVEGAVKRACSKKGCWMELGPEGADGGESCRVTFKDYGFFVPTDSAGKHARLVGQVSTKTLSRAHAEHLEAEGARVAHKNADGTALEMQIVARGVELR